MTLAVLIVTISSSLLKDSKYKLFVIYNKECHRTTTIVVKYFCHRGHLCEGYHAVALWDQFQWVCIDDTLKKTSSSLYISRYILLLNEYISKIFWQWHHLWRKNEIPHFFDSYGRIILYISFFLHLFFIYYIFFWIIVWRWLQRLRLMCDASHIFIVIYRCLLILIYSAKLRVDILLFSSNTLWGHDHV